MKLYRLGCHDPSMRNREAKRRSELAREIRRMRQRLMLSEKVLGKVIACAPIVIERAERADPALPIWMVTTLVRIVRRLLPPIGTESPPLPSPRTQSQRPRARRRALLH